MKTQDKKGVSNQLVLLFAGGSAVAIVFSIAVAQILLGAAILAALITRRRVDFPGWPILAALFAWTALAAAVNGGLAAGLPQLKKFFVFAILAAVATAFTQLRAVRWLLTAIGAACVASSAWSLVQFWRKWEYAAANGLDFYPYYVGQRTTGFMSHWMTFSGEMLVGFLILAALCLFPGSNLRQRALAGAGATLIGLAIFLNQTRSIWLALVAGMVLLVALWRPRFLLAIPVLLAGAYLAAPAPLQERIESIFDPHGEQDSNSHRVVCFRTGWEMIKANPVFGLGPEGPKRDFLKYVPADIPQPLPEGYYAHLHNVFLQYAAERGIPGLALLLLFLGFLTRQWLRAWRTAPDAARWILAVAFCVTLGTLVSGVFEYNLGNSEVLHLFLVIAACGHVASKPEPATV